MEEEVKVEEPPNIDEMSLPSDTSENLAETGVNLLGIDREIVPVSSMHMINKVAECGQWILVQSDSEKFWERKAILLDRSLKENVKEAPRSSSMLEEQKMQSPIIRGVNNSSISKSKSAI